MKDKTISEVLDDIKYTFKIVSELPQEGLKDTIYILETNKYEIKDKKTMKIYKEYIWYDGWHLLGKFKREVSLF